MLVSWFTNAYFDTRLKITPSLKEFWSGVIFLLKTNGFFVKSNSPNPVLSTILKKNSTSPSNGSGELNVPNFPCLSYFCGADPPISANDIIAVILGDKRLS